MHGSDYCVTHARIKRGEKKAEASPPKPTDESKTSGSPKAQTQYNSMNTGGFSMDERRKNVSLISGMALLLAIAAILLFGWSQIAYSPFQQEDQDMINGKLDHLGNGLHKLEDQLSEFNNVDKKAWQLYQLKNLQNTVDFLSAAGADDYKADYNKIQGDVTALIAKIAGPKAAFKEGNPKAALKGDCPKSKAKKDKAAKGKKSKAPKANATQ